MGKPKNTNLYSEMSYFEHLSVAAREPTYSAALSFFLGEHSTLDLQTRARIIVEAFSPTALVAKDIQRISTQTEWNKVDLLITMECKNDVRHIAVEVKIKSDESPNQLADYDKTLKEGGKDPVDKVFLTLNGTPPMSGEGWKPVSWESVLGSLKCKGTKRCPYLKDFRTSIEKLLNAVSEVSTDSGLADFVFEGWRNPDGAETGIRAYILQMRLPVTLQVQWMTFLRSQLEIPNNLEVEITETRANALFDIYFKTNEEPILRIGIQIQNKKAKIFCAPDPYPENATTRQHKAVDNSLRRLADRVGKPPNVKFSPKKVRGFRSFSIADLPNERDTRAWLEKLREHIRLVETLCNEAN